MGFAKKRIGKDGKPRYTASMSTCAARSLGGDLREREGRGPGLAEGRG